METDILAVFANQGPALLLAFWVIQKGEGINKTLLDRQDQTVAALEANYRATQTELLTVLKTLCLPKDSA